MPSAVGSQSGAGTELGVCTTVPTMAPDVHLEAGDALLLIDVQNDFLPGGRLAVSGGDGIIAPLNRLIRAFDARKAPIFATRDWHPPDHCSFIAQGGPWPPHCVARTRGAEFAKDLKLPSSVHVISKAMMPEKEAYSGFEETSLHEELFAADVCRIFVGGLATDYCVLNTVRDAIGLGYQVFLVRDAMRAVNVRPDDEQKAIVEMENFGAVPITSAMIADLREIHGGKNDRKRVAHG